MLQEGITEAGAFSSWIAAATSYSNHGVQMIPFYVFYSMFGFQRIGDLAWAAGDSRARGFLLGGTAGRTTLNGEGLQHEDGHSHLLSATVPNCVAYDPAYAYELAVIVHDGLRRTPGDQEDVFFYLTVMNENYAQPAIPEGAEEGILRGMHQIAAEGARSGCSGPARSCARYAAGSSCATIRRRLRRLERTSFTELRRDGMRVERGANRLGDRAPGRSVVGRGVARRRPMLRARRSSPPPTTSARCPTDRRVGARAVHRARARTASAAVTPLASCARFFEVDRHHVVVATLRSLGRDGEVEPSVVADAIKKYEIDTDRARPGGVADVADEVKVPDIGDFDEVPVIEILVAEGDAVDRRAGAGHARVRQGDDGRAVAGGWDREGRSRFR